MKEILQNLTPGEWTAILSMLATLATIVFGGKFVIGKIAVHAEKIDKIVDTLAEEYPQIPYVSLVAQITEIVKIACQSAEQKAKNGEIKPGERFDVAKRDSIELLRVDGVTVSNDILCILDTVIEGVVGAEIPSKSCKK